MAKSNVETAKNIAKELEELLPNGYVAIVGGGKWTEKAKQELIARIQAMPTEKEDYSELAAAMIDKLCNENKAKETPTMKNCDCHCCSCLYHNDNIEEEDYDDDDDEDDEDMIAELENRISELEAETSELQGEISELETENSELYERLQQIKNIMSE
jgi:hypothetical protein